MVPSVRSLMFWLSDVSLVLMVVGVNMLCIYTWVARNRDGRVLQRLSDFFLALTLFFNWYGIVYIDRRWDIWPSHDLRVVMDFEWYWVPHLTLLLTTVSLLWVLIRIPTKEKL